MKLTLFRNKFDANIFKAFFCIFSRQYKMLNDVFWYFSSVLLRVVQKCCNWFVYISLLIHFSSSFLAKVLHLVLHFASVSVFVWRILVYPCQFRELFNCFAITMSTVIFFYRHRGWVLMLNKNMPRLVAK